ncbi:MAG: DNA-processing protein DprA [Candidatus Doudnabacteria bacterium]|nr:DNA-processing protein DprA [Candidatus Doudnabacteria bacterium]
MNLLDEKIYGNSLNLIPGLGPVNLNRLRNHFGGFVKAWQGEEIDFQQAGLQPQAISQIIANKSKINPEQAFAEVTRRQIEIILPEENSYPQLLKEIIPAPPILYIRGKKEFLKSTSIAVVGTRKMTSYGQMVCEDICSGLTTNGITIVSGLAFGIDAIALDTAVKNSGPAIAVLASDLDNFSISPRSNLTLAQKIIENGCLVSEYALGNGVQKGNFIVRNRIISGLSLGTLVIEADASSGALITANHALEQNRGVFAIPGSIYSQVSRGTNQLIKQGAKLVNSVYDVLEDLNLDVSNLPDNEEMIATNEIEVQILQFLTKEPVHIDDLIKTVKLPPSQINANLTILEMKGRIKNLGGAKYVKIR